MAGIDIPVFLFFVGLFGTICGVIAHSKGHNPWPWVLGGMAMAILAIPAVIMLRRREES